MNTEQTTQPMVPYSVSIEQELLKYFDGPVIQTLLPGIREQIIDYILLKNLLLANRTQFSDYSFLLQPICKALEGQVFNSLLWVGFFSDSDNPKSLGAKLNDENKLNTYKESLIASGVDKKLAASTVKRIQSMSDFYHRNRNLPMHIAGSSRSTIQKAEMTAASIMQEINDFTTDMANTGMSEPLNEIFKR